MARKTSPMMSPSITRFKASKDGCLAMASEMRTCETSAELLADLLAASLADLLADLLAEVMAEPLDSFCR